MKRASAVKSEIRSNESLEVCFKLSHRRFQQQYDDHNSKSGSSEHDPMQYSYATPDKNIPRDCFGCTRTVIPAN